jgi:osmotically-inducible protein OsmY
MLDPRATHHLIGSAILALFALAAAPGCNREQPTTETTAPPSAAASAPARDDPTIATQVRARFYTDDTIRERRIDVTAKDGVVTLRGAVDNQAAKQRAIDVAQNVEGVVRVNDELTVAGTASAASAGEPAATSATGTAGRDATVRSPAWITTKIQAQYFLSSTIKPSTVDVSTSDSRVVTLEGTVDTEEKKTEALRIARTTDGVAEIVDHITVRAGATGGSLPIAGAIPEVGQPDPWVTAKIQARYFMDDDIKARNIDVDTRHGQVTLGGTVGSEAERRQAVAIARNTGGVKDVVDRLRVQGSEARDTAGGRPADRGSQPLDADAWTTTKVQAKYFIDSDLKSREINVGTRGGVVTLEGTVDTDAQRTEAEQIARETPGVTRVVNQLAVRPGQKQ